jgi:hypothetical protein
MSKNSGIGNMLLFLMAITSFHFPSISSFSPIITTTLKPHLHSTISYQLRSSNDPLKRISSSFVPHSLQQSTTTILLKSTNNSSDSNESMSRKRRKRKDGKNVTATSQGGEQKKLQESVELAAPPTTKVASSVQMQIRDIRDVVSGTTTSNTVSNTLSNYEDEDDDDYEYYDDDEEEDYKETSKFTPNNKIKDNDNNSSSLEALLADAKRIRAREQDEKKERGITDENEISIPQTIRNVLSTIVTVDFFVVCALLLWFLAGIFCSYVVKDDTVQIAFNGIFQPVVQPALGVLMIGSALSAVFQDPPKDE